MKRSKKKILISFIVTAASFFALVISTMAFTTTAWFSTILHFNTDTNASSISNYYAGGTGTEDDPYLIATPRHVYNFSWLQNSGIYADEKTYFKLQNDIDMAGALTGFVSNTSGAIPPIGTDEYPFYGSFDGNGKTLKNLWVSSDPLDWKEKPSNFDFVNVGESIGFFGNINQKDDGDIIGEAYHFYLENFEVTTKVNNSYVGIVAGMVNGNLEAVGVKNAKINLGPATQNVDSDYVLVGVLGPNVSWDDAPGDDIGGNLLVDPNSETNVFNSISYPNAVQAPDSIIGRAYYVGDANVIQTNINTSNSRFLKFSADVIVNPNADQVIRTDSAPMITLNANNYTEHVTDHYWERIQYIYSRRSVRTVMFGQTTYAPTINAQGRWNNPINLPSEAFAPDAPRNSIWFKPLTGGTSGLAFFRTNQGANEESISVYHYKRENNRIVNLHETRFAIDKNSLGNREGVYFDFVIPQQLAVEGYEFVVGISSVSPATSAGFLYLSLSGTDISGGENNSQVQHVDWTYYTSSGMLENLTNPDYTPKHVHFDFAEASTGNAYFNMLDYPQNDGRVYYSNDPSIDVQNVINKTVGTSTTYNTNTFPPRQESI